MDKHASMTIEQLEATQQELQAQKDEIQQQLRQVARVLDEQRTAAAMAADLAAFERKHGVSVQQLAPAGIESAESVNGG